MEDLLSLLGVDAPPPAAELPAVVYHASERRRKVVGENLSCAHCAMNRARWHRNPASIPQWRSKDDIVTHPAVVLITNTDGSALGLCGQHVREYDDKRGDRDG